MLINTYKPVRTVSAFVLCVCGCAYVRACVYMRCVCVCVHACVLRAGITTHSVFSLFATIRPFFTAKMLHARPQLAPTFVFVYMRKYDWPTAPLTCVSVYMYVCMCVHVHVNVCVYISAYARS